VFPLIQRNAFSGSLCRAMSLWQRVKTNWFSHIESGTRNSFYRITGPGPFNQRFWHTSLLTDPPRCPGANAESRSNLTPALTSRAQLDHTGAVEHYRRPADRGTALGPLNPGMFQAGDDPLPDDVALKLGHGAYDGVRGLVP
jgi:hypothetical protein